MTEPPYRRRIVDDELDELLPALAAIEIAGARGVGKTTTAARRAATVLRLDEEGPRDLVRADPAEAIRRPRPLLVDEWQRVPPVWDAIRRAVDDGAPAGSLLLTGSMAPIELPVHSGAGRIARVVMRPLTLAERALCGPTVSLARLLDGARPKLDGHCPLTLPDYAEAILGSGFPAVADLTGRASRSWLDGYLQRVVDRDFAEVGHRVRAPDGLRRWMRAYAAATATTATFETIRRAAMAGEGVEPSRSSIAPYRDALDALNLLDPVPGWAPTRRSITRLALAPKHGLVDPALAGRLLGLRPDDLLDPSGAGRAVVIGHGHAFGPLFESLVTQSVRVYAAAAEARVGHLRTKGGREEVDLIVERGDRVVAIEVKLGAGVSDHDVRHLNWLAARLGDGLVDALVVTTGADAYRRADGIGVVPAGLLGP